MYNSTLITDRILLAVDGRYLRYVWEGDRGDYQLVLTEDVDEAVRFGSMTEAMEYVYGMEWGKRMFLLGAGVKVMRLIYKQHTGTLKVVPWR